MQLHHSNWIRIIKPQANLDKPPKNSKEPHRLQRSPLLLKRHQSTKHYKIPCKEDNIYIHLAWILCEIVRIKRTQVAEVGRMQRAWTSESWETYRTRKAGISTQRRTCQKAHFFLLACNKAVFFRWPLSSKLSNKNSRTHKLLLLLLLLRNHRFFTWVWEQPKLPASSSSAPAPWALQISSAQGLKKQGKKKPSWEL